MATQKSKNNEALAAHCLVYAACFAPWGFKFVVFTFLTHFVTDYWTSRLTSKLWFVEFGESYAPNLYDWAKFDPFKRSLFFKTIGLDQLVHFITLALIYQATFPG